MKMTNWCILGVAPTATTLLKIPTLSEESWVAKGNVHGAQTAKRRGRYFLGTPHQTMTSFC